MKRPGKPNEKSVERVIREIDNSRNEHVNLLKELVRIRTVNPPGENYVECANFLSRRFKEIGMDTNLVRVPETELRKNDLELPRVSVLSRLKGAKSNRTLHINGHYDVVPTAPGWTFDPFGGTVSNGRLYGRGATDMKCGLVAMMMAAAAILRSGVELNGDLTMSATPDEETGGDLGAGFLVKNGFIKGDSTIVAEGSRFNEVALAHKGAFWLEIKTIGRSAHGSSPDLGLNAVTSMARIVLALDDLGSQLINRRTPSSPLFSDVPSPTLMVGGLIKGGVKTNVVPGESTCTVDRRFLPEESVKDIEHEILSVVRRAAALQPGLRTETRRLAVMPPSSCPREAAIAQCLVRSVELVNGKAPHIMGVSGFTDAHFFSQLMPTVMYGPQILEKAHAEDEYVVLEQVFRAAKVFAVTALVFLGEAGE